MIGPVELLAFTALFVVAATIGGCMLLHLIVDLLERRRR